MKVLFLIQSCNQERYLNEENILKETYLKRLRKNSDYYFYRGGYDEHKVVEDVLQLKCDDDLNSTFRKTIMALSVFQKYDYDFIIRMNTSNWVNMEMLYETLEKLDPNATEIIGPVLVSNGESYGVPFLRGNLLILNRKCVNDLLESIEDNPYNGIDDVCIALNLCKYWNSKGIDYLKSLKTFKNIIYNKRLSIDTIKKNLLVRCVERNNENDTGNKIAKIEEKYKKSLDTTISKPKNLETIIGNLKI